MRVIYSLANHHAMVYDYDGRVRVQLVDDNGMGRVKCDSACLATEEATRFVQVPSRSSLQSAAAAVSAKSWS